MDNLTKNSPNQYCHSRLSNSTDRHCILRYVMALTWHRGWWAVLTVRLLLSLLRKFITFLDLPFIRVVGSRWIICRYSKSVPEVAELSTEQEGKCRGYCEKNTVKMSCKSDAAKCPGKSKRRIHHLRLRPWCLKCNTKPYSVGETLQLNSLNICFLATLLWWNGSKLTQSNLQSSLIVWVLHIEALDFTHWM